jgi:DNA-binding transcriptional regulator GbsR (MarR family)
MNAMQPEFKMTSRKLVREIKDRILRETKKKQTWSNLVPNENLDGFEKEVVEKLLNESAHLKDISDLNELSHEFKKALVRTLYKNNSFDVIQTKFV